ncbi:MAG: hypothetical protein K5883_08365 [Pseudobutyrivibrio sp.]|nr:hypothetical protein [Pseudobutyrivibrio sp.]
MENVNVEGMQEVPVVPTVSPAPPVDNGEDLLLEQIDAFREKATQLQQLILQKERKAAELEALVKEKEAINVKLQDELSKKQEEADNLVADVETQVDRMMQVVKINMDQLEVDIKGQVNNNQESYEEHNRNLQDTLKNVSEGLDSIQNELSEKTHSESVHLYRLIQDLLKEHDNSEEQALKAVEHYSSLKKLSVVVIVLLVLTMGVSIASFILSLGVF